MDYNDRRHDCDSGILEQINDWHNREIYKKRRQVTSYQLL